MELNNTYMHIICILGGMITIILSEVTKCKRSWFVKIQSFVLNH